MLEKSEPERRETGTKPSLWITNGPVGRPAWSVTRPTHLGDWVGSFCWYFAWFNLIILSCWYLYWTLSVIYIAREQRAAWEYFFYPSFELKYFSFEFIISYEFDLCKFGSSILLWCCWILWLNLSRFGVVNQVSPYFSLCELFILLE